MTGISKEEVRELLCHLNLFSKVPEYQFYHIYGLSNSQMQSRFKKRESHLFMLRAAYMNKNGSNNSQSCLDYFTKLVKIKE